MPDASQHRPLPPDWGGAFAALPLETPPVGSWERVARALPVRRRRWPALVALAAALALVAIVPLRWSGQDAKPSAPLARTPSTTKPVHVAATQPSPAVVADPGQVADGTRSATSITAAQIDDIATMARAATGSTGDTTGAPGASPRPAAAMPAATGTTDASASQLASAATPAAGRETVEPPASPELERLYAESAQLEGLLALARDGAGDVANGAVAMLSDDLATRVAQIDAALGQPSLAGDRRIALWRERVDALRQAAAFESTQRLLAARGQQYDAMLVSID